MCIISDNVTSVISVTDLNKDCLGLFSLCMSTEKLTSRDVDGERVEMNKEEAEADMKNVVAHFSYALIKSGY